MDSLIEISERLINASEIHFIRSLYHKIHWNNRLIEIRGARGVGKTTLMLQKAKQFREQSHEVLYVSLDNSFFYKNELTQLADTFFKYGGQYLFIDEVHKYPKKNKHADWSLEIKNIYDSYPELHIIYSGSSILQLFKGAGDLSRRKAAYHLHGLSFREYLQLTEQLSFNASTLIEITENHTKIAREITKSIKILPLFSDYLRRGYFPFFNEASDVFYDRLNEVTNVILETDIPAVSDITFETSLRLKTLLSLLTQSVPFTPNLKKLASQLYIADYRTLLKYLNYLDKSELISTLNAKASGNQILNKPDKIYLNNTNLMYAISPQKTDVGTVRETFMYNQLKQAHTVNYPKQGDFTTEGFTFEVGGPNKTNKQIAGLQNAYIAKDEIETGYGNVIPLWLFGFLY